jgi:hypothetical protein
MALEKVSTFAAKFKKAFSEGGLSWARRPATSSAAAAHTLSNGDGANGLVCGDACRELGRSAAGFNALFGYTTDYKPFYDQLAKWEFAVFMRETARRLLETRVIRVLGVAPGGCFLGVSPHRHPR